VCSLSVCVSFTLFVYYECAVPSKRKPRLLTHNHCPKWGTPLVMSVDDFSHRMQLILEKKKQLSSSPDQNNRDFSEIGCSY
jgi:hypothetical protein